MGSAAARTPGSPAAPSARPPADRKPRARTDALTALRRQEILDAAIKVFSRRGFDAARAEDIAQAAHIAKGTLYLYFRSKEALYAAAISHAVHGMQSLSTERSRSAVTLREKLAAAIGVRLEFWTEHGTLHRLLLTLGREPRHRRQTNELTGSGQAMFLAIFEEGITTGDLAPGDYSALAWAILDMVRGAAERRMDRVTGTTIEQDREAVTTFALRSAGLS